MSAAQKTIGQETVQSIKIPSFWNVMCKEIYHDKIAFVSAIILMFLFVFVFIAANFINQTDANFVDLKYMNKPPSSSAILGYDPAGREIVGQLILGARNSFSISIMVTVLCGIIGIIVGLIAGYYAGEIDNIIMRIIDFMMMLPSLMIIIVLVTLIPRYNIFSFAMIMTAFGWMGKARLMRAKTLQQSSLDYVSAAKTLGTSNVRIMFGQVLPNIISIVIVNLTLSLAGNMGLETGLTFLGFGLPFATPSLGTLISYASVPENMQNRLWQWLPATILILVMMLSINFVGQAIKRAADAKQRLG